MKLLARVILLMATLFFVVKAEENVVKGMVNDIRAELRTDVNDAKDIVEETLGIKEKKEPKISYLEYVKGLVAEARTELKQNRNRRPSTEYSVQDIAFSIAQYFPNWFYPQSTWKQDPITRRRHIAKVLRSSSLVARPRVVVIRDTVAMWTKTSLNLLENKYTANTIEAFDSLTQTAHDFVATATDAELMDSFFLSSGYAALDDAVSAFIHGNVREFNDILKSINYDFNEIVGLSGDLRVSLESIRDDAVTQTQMIRNELFADNIEQRLRHLSFHIRTELQNLSQELREIPDHEKSTSKLLRKHTADALRSEIESMNDIKMTLSRSKSFYHHVWQNAHNELVQSPASYDYWVDVIAEVREAAIKLGKSLTKKHHHHQQHRCNCGYANDI